MKNYQICKSCYTECYPTGYSIELLNKHGNMYREIFIKYDSDLRGKCQRLVFSRMFLPENENNQENIKKEIFNST